MRTIKPVEDIVKDMHQVAEQLESKSDMEVVVAHLDEVMNHLDMVQKMPAKLRFIYFAATFVLTERLYDIGFFGSESDEELVIKNYRNLRKILVEKYDR